MNLSQFTYLLNNPNAISQNQFEELDAIIASFPYFQSARALHLKALYNQDSYKYNFALKKAAAHTVDRSVLFDFITSDTFLIVSKETFETKMAEINQIDVAVENNTTKEKEIVLEKNVSETITEEETNESIIDVSIKTIEKTPELDAESKENITQTISEETKNNDVYTLIAQTISQPEDAFIGNDDKNKDEKHIIQDTKLTEIYTEENNIDLSESIASKLEIGKPIVFNTQEKHSFSEWLELSSLKPIVRSVDEKNTSVIPENPEEELQTNSKIADKLAIIDKFIANNPKIKPVKEDLSRPISTPKTQDISHLTTETLAKVYLEQKKYQKAIQAYEILILKYPEKSYFFADRIKDIKILQQNN